MSRNPEKAFEALLKRHLSDNLATGNLSTKCPDENVVSAYLEGTLTEDLRADFEKHAGHCIRCQDELSLLLRSQEAVAVDPSAQLLAVKVSKGGWLRTFQYSLAWFSNLGLKPALAILAVTLISGYVGVELFQRESQRRESTAEVAQSIPQDHRRVEGEKRSHPSREKEKGAVEAKPAAPEVVNERPRANEERYLKETKNLARAGESSVPRNDALSKDASQEKSLRDVYSPAPAESSEADKTLQLENRSGGPARQGVAVGLPAAPSPELSSQVIREHSTDAAKALKNPFPAGKTNAVTRQAIPENQSVLVSAQPSTDEEAESKPDVKAKEAALEKKANVHSLSARGAVAPGKLRQEASAHPKAEGAEGSPANKKQRQLRAAGKTFELRNNVWTDLSIEEGDNREVEVIYRNSSDYRQQIKPLSAYQSVLSRDEDCLIEYQGKIYYIKNSR